MSLNSKRQMLVREDHWIPLSDLMSGLMMIFLLVAIVFMVQVQREAKKEEAQAEIVKGAATVYGDLRAQLYADLAAEFKNDLQRWDAVITKDLTLRFREPNVQFDTGSATLKPTFGTILNSFFPRYISILSSDKYRDSIEEVRIEGHTSSKWEGLDPEHAYYQNMRLSQDRTRSVLEYVLSLPRVRTELDWILPRLTANGLSSAHRIRLPGGGEDAVRSQRVEFKVRTNADERLTKILSMLKQ